MARILSVALSVLFLSACATVTENNETLVAEPLPAPAPEIQSVEPSVPEALEPPKNALVRVPKIPSIQEIMLLQTQLEVAGFNPGPVDGTLGARTLSALRRLQSGCSNLEDLVENPSSGISARSGDEIRLLQVRLKDAGFDAGPIDGVMGLKTKSALLRAQSGCTVVKDWSATLENQVQTSETVPSSMAEKQQPVPFKARPATESVRKVSSQVK